MFTVERGICKDMKTLILLSFILFLTKSFAQIQTDWFKLKLKGKVKALDEYSCEYEGDEGSVVVGTKMKYPLYFEYSFNDKGMCDTTYLRQGSGEIWVYDIPFYSKGNQIDSSYTYDESNTLVQRILFTYTDSNVIEKVYDGKEITESIVRKYSDVGLLIEEHQFLDDFERKTIFIYNSKNQLIECKFYDVEEFILTKYEYNENEDVIKEIIKKEDEPEEVVLYNYEYDSKQNWVIKYFNRKGKISRVLKRDIVYY